MGGERFCAHRSSICSNLPSGKQAPREVRGARGVRG